MPIHTVLISPYMYLQLYSSQLDKLKKAYHWCYTAWQCSLHHWDCIWRLKHGHL